MGKARYRKKKKGKTRSAQSLREMEKLVVRLKAMKGIVRIFFSPADFFSSLLRFNSKRVITRSTNRVIGGSGVD